MIQAEKLKTYEPTKFRPGYMSIKRNGVHGIFEPGKAYTRTPKKLNGLEHIELALRPFKIPIVGEIVIPGLDFETASGEIRSSNACQNAHLYIFNSIHNSVNFKGRRHYLETMRTSYYKNHPFIHFEPMLICNTKEQFDTYFKIQTETFNEEGVCWISPHHVYQPGKRTWDWMKRIPMRSLEAKIIDILPGTKGKKYEYSMGRMVCEMYENDKHEKLDKPIQFKVGIFKGKSDAWRQSIFNEKEMHISKYITIEFKGYTKYGVPSQARYKAFRKDII